ncbi:MAG: ABC transporter permease [Planctomycetota bacterium]
MIARIIRRLILGLFTILAVYAVTFLLVISIPGNPLQQSERSLPREVEQALRARYDMDNNWRYFTQFLTGAIQLDFGPSFTYNDWTCTQIVASALPVSLLLGTLAMLLAVGIGVPLGALSAAYRYGWLDSIVTTIVLLIVSLPTFVVGSVFLLLFAVKWNWCPIGGWGSLSHLPLPALTLSLPFLAAIIRLTRASMLDVFGSDYIRTAVAKGLRPSTVIWKHAMKPAFLPVLSYLGPATAQALTGSFVVEKVFGVPGLGQHFVNAALNRDAGLVLGTTLVFSTILVTLNLLVDVWYAWLDPRIAGAV